MSIKRGEIYFVDLDPVVGYEIGGNKRRPVVVLSINLINKNASVVTVVPGTSLKDKARPYRNVVVVGPAGTNGLSVDTVFQCHQIRALDHSRFTGAAAGAIGSRDLQMIEESVKFSLGLG